METEEKTLPALLTIKKLSKILDAFLEKHGEPMTVAELSKATRLNRTTVWRLALSMEQEHLLERTRHGDRFRLGLKLLHLGTLVQGRIELRQVAAPIMRHLSASTRESVYLSVRVGNHRVCIELVESTLPIKHKIMLGEVTALYAGAASKLLLAHMDPDDRQSYLKEVRLERLAQKTLTDPVALEVELEKIRSVDVAFSFSERFEGSSSVAVPVRDFSGRTIAALSIAGPASRMEEAGIDNLIKQVQEAGLEISALMGFQAEHQTAN